MQEKSIPRCLPKYFITDQMWVKAIGCFDLLFGVILSIMTIFILVDNADHLIYIIKNITFEGCSLVSTKDKTNMDMDIFFTLKVVAGIFGLFVYIGMSIYLVIGAHTKNIKNCRFWFQVHGAALISQITILFISINKWDADCIGINLSYSAYRVYGICVVRDFIESLEIEEKPVVDNNDQV